MDALKIQIDVDGECVVHDVYVDQETGLDVDIDTGKMCPREETIETVRTIYRIGRTSLQDDIRKTTDWHKQLQAVHDSEVNIRRVNLHGEKSHATQKKPVSKYDPSMLSHKSSEELKALGNEALLVGKVEDAIFVYTKAIEKGATAVLHANRAEAYIRQHKYSEALADACKSVTMDPRYGKGYYRKAVALIKTGHPTEALKALRTGLAHTAHGPGKCDFEQRIKEVEFSLRSVKTRREFGLGLVAYAAVAFEAGQTVLCEPPILTWSQKVEDIACDIKELAQAAQLDLALVRMVDSYLHSTLELRTALDALYCPSFSVSQSTINLVKFATDVCAKIERAKAVTTPEGLVRAIMTCRVNSHQCAAFTSDGTELCGLFPTACRLMHSCAPNLIYHRHEGVMKFVALRSIAEDETLSFSYTASRALVESNFRRRRQLEKANLFICRCDRCRGKDHTRGFLCSLTPSCTGTVLWTGAYQEDADAVIPLVRFERHESEGWRCDRCMQRAFAYQLPLEAEAGLEAALDEINTERVTNVKDKYHNLKQVTLAVKHHLGDRHWTFGQLCVLLCKYHRTMGTAFQQASATRPLGLVSQRLAMHWGVRYLRFLHEVGGILFEKDGGNSLVGHMWRTALGRSCTKYPEFHPQARWLYEECLPFFTVVYGDTNEAVREMATFIVECKKAGVEAAAFGEPFPEDINELFVVWESSLQQESQRSIALHDQQAFNTVPS